MERRGRIWSVAREPRRPGDTGLWDGEGVGGDDGWCLESEVCNPVTSSTVCQFPEQDTGLAKKYVWAFP